MAEKSKKPAIRFAGFTEAWEQRKLEGIIQECNVRTSDFRNNPLYSLTIENGVTPKTERYERSSLVIKTEDLFKVVKPNVFVTNPMNLRFGALGYNKNTFNVAVSGYYDVFSIDDNKCSGFWNSYFKTSKSIKIFDDVATGSLIEKRRVKYSTLQQLELYMPKDLDEKIQIGSYMNQIDNLITLHQRKYDKLVNVKKAMLEKMFPKDGADVPEIRFKGFTEAWEQRKVSDIGEVITGSTPPTHHSEYYSEDGIPWVTPTDIVDNIIHDTPRKLSPLGEKVGRVVPANTILVTCIASIGKNTMLANAGSFNQQINGLVPDKKKYDSYFLLTESFHWASKMKREAAAGTMQIVNKNEFSAIDTYVPEWAEQKAIGNYFRQLENLITLHQRKLEKLKNLKKACLEKMFV